ncbi:MAG: rRNA pseudouridine synthase [Mucilaginibacter polytrichastri]|nr:rRNA pseudouridine synthase [Mucilaginibacter polytrichastri]
MKSNRQEKGRPAAGRKPSGSFGKSNERSRGKSGAKEGSGQERGRSFGEKRFDNDTEKSFSGRRSFSPSGRSGEAAKNKSPYRKFEKRTDGEQERSSFRGQEDRSFSGRKSFSSSGRYGEAAKNKSPFRKRAEGDQEQSSFRSGDRFKSGDSFKKNDYKKSTRTGKPDFAKRFDKEDRDVRFDKGGKRTPEQTRRVVKGRAEREENFDKRSTYKTGHESEAPKAFVRTRKAAKEGNEPIRLNRYIANSGICSRRKADELIQAGVVTVNGAVVDELGFKVDPAKDEVRYNGELLRREKKVYVLLNKPKDYITTTEDPQERRTVMQLVSKATKDRIYPVGRLDRNTTGLLLLTNDGDLAEKLSHPRNNVTKIYLAELSRNLTQGDMNKIQYGLELEDGFVKPDAVSYVQGGSKREIGIQIHSGKNRIVRRIFEHLGYEVLKLDRTIYANLTKKDLPRGKWRFLDEKELIQLRQFAK